MNERVKELAAQAKFIAEETIDRKISKNAELDAFAEKFAELIVEECMDIISNKVTLETNEDYREGFHRAQQFIWQDINKHFGVEEN